MKHLKALIILSLFLSSNLHSQVLEELDKYIATRNNIQTKTRIDYKYVSGEQSANGVKSSITTYNESGNIVKVEYFNSKGSVTSTEKYAYDVNGNRILREGPNKYKKAAKYNSKNQLLSESGFNGTEEFHNEFSYNSDGKLSQIIYQVGGRTQLKMVYTHSGNTANVNIYGGGTTLSSKMKMIYNDDGKLLEETTYSIDGQELEKKNYLYTSKSQLEEETKTSKGNFNYRLSYVYNSADKLVTLSEETLSKKKYIKKEYSYDIVGNLISYKWRRKPEEAFNEKKYTYNHKGVCLTEHTFYPKTKYELLSKFEYDFY